MAKIYLDSCIIIYLIQGEPVHRNPIERRMQASHGDEFCLSELTKMECHVMPLRCRDFETLNLYKSFSRRYRLTNIVIS
jgi:predicted nucleic acid-binding protein